MQSPGVDPGSRGRGGRKKRFKDTLKASMKDFGIDNSPWKKLGLDRYCLLYVSLVS